MALGSCIASSDSWPSVTGDGGGSSSAYLSPIAEKYEFIKAAFSSSSCARVPSSPFKGAMLFRRVGLVALFSNFQYAVVFFTSSNIAIIRTPA